MLFREKQYFKYRWVAGIFIFISYLLILGLMLNTDSYENTSMAFLVAFSVFMLVILLIIVTVNVELMIDKYSINYKHIPFIWSWKTIERETINKVTVVKYSAISEYGGYGYRITPGKGTAIIMGGDMGMKIIYNEKKKLLLGTQKPEELKKAVVALKRKEE